MSGHLPVMLDEVIESIEPRDGAIYIDGTFGGGSYSRALLDAAECRVLAIDLDPDAIARGRELGFAIGVERRVADGTGEIENAALLREYLAVRRRNADAAFCVELVHKCAEKPLHGVVSPRSGWCRFPSARAKPTSLLGNRGKSWGKIWARSTNIQGN